MKRLFLPILVTLSMFTVSCDKDSVTNPDDVPVSVTESELKEAFYYTFPLMIMDATESVETNTETFVPGIPRAPVNQLIHAVKLADASNKSVVTPNVDTYYSRLWMDMNEEPVVFEFPDVKDRFCNIQVLDAWTNTTKLITDGGTYVFAKKGQTVTVPSGATLVEMCPCPILAVTGSDGKTTTTTIISKLLAAEGKIVHVGGNIGHPLLCDTPEIAPEDMAVLELSSFQLMTMQTSPHIAVTTNLAPNHLDVHKDYQEYVNAKANIFTHQTAGDIAVFNADNADTVEQAAKAVGEVRWFSRKQRVDNGVFCENGVIYEAANGTVTPIMETKDVLLPGVHNIENYMAAFAAVRGMVSYETMREIAKTFGGVEHRIELIRTRKGVRWYNDSIASSPSRTIAGLNSFPEQVILIAGGKDKGISYAPLGPVVNDHVKLLLLCGKTAGVIREAVEQAENYHGLEILDVADYHEAVAIADARSQPGDVVILSPASTSFDRFANFMERGQVFKAIVNELK